jgi:hypothetical protein
MANRVQISYDDGPWTDTGRHAVDSHEAAAVIGSIADRRTEQRSRAAGDPAATPISSARARLVNDEDEILYGPVDID